MKPTLLILAAGMGSRYGGLKQLDPVGPCDEVVMEYSVYDAMMAGFERVLFVIRPDMEDAFQKTIGQKLEKHIDTGYVFQTLEDLPAGYTIPNNREKPWGTAHAVWCARNNIDTPFSVINADDFYGQQSFAILGKQLQQMSAITTNYCMVGFELQNTLSEHGPVSRGVCKTNENNLLVSISEHTKIKQDAGGIVDAGEKPATSFSGSEAVSMNLWGFAPSLFDYIEKSIINFLPTALNNPKAEIYIPSVLSPLIQQGVVSVSVLPSPSSWFGVTYTEDRPATARAIAGLTDQGIYSAPLWPT